MQHGPRERWNGRVLVVDPDALPHLVAQSVQARGGYRAAARRFGISASQLSRLSRNPVGRINRTTLQRLQRLAPQELRAALADCLLPPPALERVRRQSADWTADLRRRLRRLRAHVTDAMALLDRIGHRALDSLAPSVHRWSKGNEQHEIQLLLASWWRVVEPVLQGGLLAADWRTMPEDELRVFVDAGIARERILLGPLDPVHPKPSGRTALQLAIAQLRRKALGRNVAVPADPRELYRVELQNRRGKQAGDGSRRGVRPHI